jgi:hypothetical protein
MFPEAASLNLTYKSALRILSKNGGEGEYCSKFTIQNFFGWFTLY